VIRTARSDLQGLIDVAKAGGNAPIVAEEINDAQRRLDDGAANLKSLACQIQAPLDADTIRKAIEHHGATLLAEAAPVDMRRAFVEMGLQLRYDPAAATITGEIDLAPTTGWGYVGVGGGTHPADTRAVRWALDIE
jgi:hypothetical protein